MPLSNTNITKSILFLLMSIAGLKFVSWPNAVGGYINKSVTLQWTVDKPVNRTWEGNITFDMEPPKLVCKWKTLITGAIQASYGSDYDANKVSLNVTLGSKSVDVTLHNLEIDDARYNYVLIIVVDGNDTLINSVAWIVIYSEYIVQSNLFFSAVLNNE